MGWICLGLWACGLTSDRDHHMPSVNYYKVAYSGPTRQEKKNTKKLGLLIGPTHSWMGQLWAGFEPYVLVFGSGLDVKLG